MDKKPEIFLEHILASINSVESFLDGVSKDDFFENDEKQSAVIKKLEIIGEAAKNIPDNFKNKYSEVPWAQICGMINRIFHEYFSVDLNIVWDTANKNLPSLRKQIVMILETLDKQKKLL